ncbi:hypothetical protein RIR_jg17801.t1 [Rhizophagus irregularis DAOM 181602=DAOM 197198]|nr:hypothetical protein RIR_jg17801.t1 [Rhizophagus irregularis DAOM 181602=DAOM 197198]
MSAITSWPDGYVRITRSFCYLNSKHHILCSRIKKDPIEDSPHNANLVTFQILNVSFAQAKRVQVLQGYQVRGTLLRHVGIADKSMTNWVVLRLDRDANRGGLIIYGCTKPILAFILTSLLEKSLLSLASQT